MTKFLKTLYYYVRNKYHVALYRRLVLSRVPQKVINAEEYLKHYRGESDPGELFTVVFKSGLKVRCNNNDLSAVSETCVLEDYAPIPRLAIKPGQVVVDVGANIGSFSVYAAHRGAKVYAVEPEPRNIERIRENVVLNGCESRVTIIPAALHTSSGTISFTVSEHSAGGHTAVSGLVDGERLTVVAKSLDNLLLEYGIDRVDLLKMDIEGAEYDILENLSDQTLSKIGAIVGEYHVSPVLKVGYVTLRQRLCRNYQTVRRYDPYYFYAFNE